jgi:hypothetical protein
MQRRSDVHWWHTAVPQDIDGAIARWRKASSPAPSNSLIMRPADAAERRPVALPPSRGATAQDSAPDDDLFQVRKVAAFACGLGLKAGLGLRPSAPRAEDSLRLVREAANQGLIDNPSNLAGSRGSGCSMAREMPLSRSR